MAITPMINIKWINTPIDNYNTVDETSSQEGMACTLTHFSIKQKYQAFNTFFGIQISANLIYND